MKEFKVGEEVYSLFLGRGVVNVINKADNNKNREYIVEVTSFHNKIAGTPYSKTGHSYLSKNRCLFHADEFIRIEKDETVSSKPFEVGDKVICLVFGQGEIVEIEDDDTCYPVLVELYNTGILKYYTLLGGYFDDDYKTLYHADEKPRVVTRGK